MTAKARTKPKSKKTNEPTQNSEPKNAANNGTTNAPGDGNDTNGEGDSGNENKTAPADSKKVENNGGDGNGDNGDQVVNKTAGDTNTPQADFIKNEEDPGMDPEWQKQFAQIQGTIISDPEQLAAELQTLTGSDVLTTESFAPPTRDLTVRPSTRPKKPKHKEIVLPNDDAPKDRRITLIGWSDYTEFKVPVDGEPVSIVLQFKESTIWVPQEVAELCQIEGLKKVFIIN